MAGYQYFTRHLWQKFNFDFPSTVKWTLDVWPFFLRWTTWTVMSSCPTWHPCLTPIIAPRASFKSVLLFLPVLSALPKEVPVPEVVLLVSVFAVSVSLLVILAFSLPIQWMSVFVWAVRNSEKLVTWIFNTNFYVRLPFSLLYHGRYLPIFFVGYLCYHCVS